MADPVNKTRNEVKEMAQQLVKKGCTYREAEKLLRNAGYQISVSTIHRLVLQRIK
jgi:thermostable 8-oxoguanine DNA glycosylase